MTGDENEQKETARVRAHRGPAAAAAGGTAAAAGVTAAAAAGGIAWTAGCAVGASLTAAADEGADAALLEESMLLLRGEEMIWRQQHHVESVQWGFPAR